MKNKTIWLGVLCGVVALIIIARYLIVRNDTNSALHTINTSTQTVTYLTSPDDTTNYCNGQNMNSAEYRKTITIPVTTTTAANLSQTELVKFVLNAATTGMCQAVLRQSNISVANGVVTIPPFDGWAGISIALCSCQPQVEVNALNIPGITKVVWGQ